MSFMDQGGLSLYQRCTAPLASRFESGGASVASVAKNLACLSKDVYISLSRSALTYTREVKVQAPAGCNAFCVLSVSLNVRQIFFTFVV